MLLESCSRCMSDRAISTAPGADAQYSTYPKAIFVSVLSTSS